ncbi:MAG: hypothetical protein OXH31_06385 [Gammaproteobacteria bacterium]|nr:hypothetical protein [Gammaproteobacteria bacterium]
MADSEKFKITVNNKLVFLKEKEQTGFSIKKSAIEQGVDIKIDFVLSVVEKDGTTADDIKDDEPIEIYDDQIFVAVDPEDNAWFN